MESSQEATDLFSSWKAEKTPCKELTSEIMQSGTTAKSV